MMQSALARLASGIYLRLNNKRYELLDENWHGYILFIDHDENDIVFANPVLLDRPIADTKTGNISRHEFEKLVDMFLEEEDEVNMFMRYDVIHVFVNLKTNGAITRHHQHVTPYEVEEEE